MAAMVSSQQAMHHPLHPKRRASVANAGQGVPQPVLRPRFAVGKGLHLAMQRLGRRGYFQGYRSGLGHAEVHLQAILGKAHSLHHVHERDCVLSYRMQRERPRASCCGGDEDVLCHDAKIQPQQLQHCLRGPSLNSRLEGTGGAGTHCALRRALTAHASASSPFNSAMHSIG